MGECGTSTTVADRSGHESAYCQFVGGRKDDTMRVAFGSAWVLEEHHGEIWRIDLEKLERLPLPP